MKISIGVGEFTSALSISWKSFCYICSIRTWKLPVDPARITVMNWMFKSRPVHGSNLGWSLLNWPRFEQSMAGFNRLEYNILCTSKWFTTPVCCIFRSDLQIKPQFLWRVTASGTFFTILSLYHTPVYYVPHLKSQTSPPLFFTLGMEVHGQCWQFSPATHVWVPSPGWLYTMSGSCPYLRTQLPCVHEMMQLSCNTLQHSGIKMWFFGFPGPPHCLTSRSWDALWVPPPLGGWAGAHSASAPHFLLHEWRHTLASWHTAWVFYISADQLGNMGVLHGRSSSPVSEPLLAPAVLAWCWFESACKCADWVYLASPTQFWCL